MADVNRGNRPLSPHLTIYRSQWTGGTSIVTRITGNALIGAVVLIISWLVALVLGPQPYAFVNGVITSWFGDAVMVAALWALWYHTLAGIRHLIWDTGRLFEVAQAELAGKAIVAGAFVLTALTVLVLRGAA